MSDVTRPGRELAARFQALGDMTGKSAGEIASVVGLPNARSATGGNATLLQWQATGYHIAILFDSEDCFSSITHESANFEPEPNYMGAFIILIVLVVIAVVIGIVSAS